MITKRRLNIPIFNYKLVIVIYDKWEEVKDMHSGIISKKTNYEGQVILPFIFYQTLIYK
nr:MAG TPA: hypothetical protein [Caudoviricetes sp.]